MSTKPFRTQHWCFLCRHVSRVYFDDRWPTTAKTTGWLANRLANTERVGRPHPVPAVWIDMGYVRIPRTQPAESICGRIFSRLRSAGGRIGDTSRCGWLGNLAATAHLATWRPTARIPA